MALAALLLSQQETAEEAEELNVIANTLFVSSNELFHFNTGTK
jgi:hypothetical protein